MSRLGGQVAACTVKAPKANCRVRVCNQVTIIVTVRLLQNMIRLIVIENTGNNTTTDTNKLLLLLVVVVVVGVGVGGTYVRTY